MAAEFYIKFQDNNWYSKNKNKIKTCISKLKTFVKETNDELWLKGIENINDPYYDVRFFFNNENFILMEIEFHPHSIEQSIDFFLNWIRKQTSISIEDEDGEPYD
jgi:hypothetical protein